MSNMFVKGLRPTSLALALLCSAMGTTHANNAVVTQTSASLTNLSIQLIDLNPNDATLPSINFHNAGMIMGSFFPDGSEIMYENGLLPATPVTYYHSSGLTSVTTNQNQAIVQSQINIDTLLEEETPILPLTSYWSFSAETSAILAAGFEEQSIGLTLSAGSQMIIRGSISVDANFDLTSLQDQLSIFGHDIVGFSFSTSSSALFGLGAYDEEFNVTQLNSIEISATKPQSSISMNDIDGLTWSYQNSHDFEFILTNSSDETMNGGFALFLGANPYLSISTKNQNSPIVINPPIDINPPVVPAIPEPSTYALMGLGLIGVMAAARRRRTH